MPDMIWNNNCVTVGERAWHLRDLNFQVATSATEGLAAMGGGHRIELRPVMVYLNDGMRSVPNNFALVRVTNDPKEDEVFEYVTERFTSFNPSDVASIFDEKVGKSISSMGFLQEGRKMFVCWNLPSFDVVKGDEIKLFGNTLIGFDSKFSSGLYVGSTRIVCKNTWNAMIQEANSNKESGKGRIFSGKHTSSNLLYELGEWMGYVSETAEQQAELVKNFFGKLVETKIVHESQAKDLIAEAYKYPDPVPSYYPDSLRAKKQESIDAKAERVDEIRDSIWNIFSTSEGIAIDHG